MNKIIYLIGQPGSGKTSIGLVLNTWLFSGSAFHIDGDILRKVFDNKNYTKTGRIKNIKRAHDIALYLSTLKGNVIISLVSPYVKQRELFKKNKNVIEIYLYTTEDRGKNIFHVNDYEVPTKNFISFDTTGKTSEESTKELILKIKEYETNIGNNT